MKTYLIVLMAVILSNISFAGSMNNLEFYLLIGQSNMAGRAPVLEEDEGVISNCYLFSDKAEWEPATNPLNRYSTIRKDIEMQKLGPGYMFGIKMAEASDHPIGLIVNARGGSSINDWAKGTQFFSDAVTRVKEAQKNATLRGILWHQGESDHDDPEYMTKIQALIVDFRAEFGNEKLPFVAGQINSIEAFNNMINTLPEFVNNTAVASSDGLVAFDTSHFNNESAKKLGSRYAEQMQELLTAAALEDHSRELQQNEKIVFLGDSITAAGVNHNGYITLCSKKIAALYPDLGVNLIGAGISGDKVPDCQNRLEKDVLSHNPSLVIIYIGINDVWHWTKPDPQTGARRKGTTAEEYTNGIQDMITRIQATGSRVILCTPSVINENSTPDDESYIRLDQYANICRQLATKNKVQLIDYRKEFLRYLENNNLQRVSKGILTLDGVHLNAIGHDFVAEILLKALGAESDGPISGALKTSDVISLWPQGTAGVRTDIVEETKSPDDRYFNIFNPTIEVIKPEIPNGSAMIICPGGGYGYICSGKEGRQIAEEFAPAGITSFVLKYRLPTTAGANFEHPVSLSDAQRAIKYVRYHAKDLGLDPTRIGVMGFSAGGHLASMVATLFDKPVHTQGDFAAVSCRPDFAVLVYPVINSYTKGVAHGCVSKLVPANQLKTISSELNVTENTPPTYLVHAKDDHVVVPQNSILMYEALKAKGVKTEIKLYEKGGHGFGVGRTGEDSSVWISECKKWLTEMSVISAAE